MGQGDFLPISGHRRHYDPKHAQQIKEGGKKADAIRKQATKQHKEVEVPKAEEELLKDLEAISTSKPKN